MKGKTNRTLILTLALLAGAALVAVAWAAPGLAPQAGGAPGLVAYQGEVRVSGVPYNGPGYFKFALVNQAGITTYWSNDGTSTAGSPPAAAVQITVNGGLFGVLLGDTSLGGMTQPLAASAFATPDRYLRVWFSSSPGGPFDQLGPDTRIASVPYALQAQEAVDADTVDGLHAHQLAHHYHNLVVVAKSGGDFASVQAAIDSISDATEANAYLVWVAPGVYEEQVEMKPHVHLQGAGQDVTTIASDANSDVWPPDQVTLVLSSHSSLRDLTVENDGAADGHTAMLARQGCMDTLVADVTARATGGGVGHSAIFLEETAADVTLQQVTALAENASSNNTGLVYYDADGTRLLGGTYTARGGEKAWAIFARYGGGTLVAEGISALAENATQNNTAMYPYDGAEVVLLGGEFVARGGAQTNGIADQLNATVRAYDVTALAENAVDNYGLGSFDGSSMTVRGATVTARGGTYCNAVGTSYQGSTLDAESVVGLAEDCSGVNYGLYVGADTAHATVRGGSYTGRGGDDARGIMAEESNVTLYAESVTALGENSSAINIGLSNEFGATTELRGGSFTGRGGTLARGIFNEGDDSTLDAAGVTALGENGTELSAGLANRFGGDATLHGGSFTGRGTGDDSCGLLNGFTGANLVAVGVTALAEDGQYATGLLNFTGARATLDGGSFTGRGGQYSHGINNGEPGATLEASGITALAEDGGDSSTGLINRGDAQATLSGGAFIGLRGPGAYGLHNDGTLDLGGVTAKATGGTSDNFGFFNETGTATADSSQFTGASSGLLLESGTVNLGVSQLDGGATNNGGTLKCFSVYDGAYNAYTCP
jgi:hypothetical protein